MDYKKRLDELEQLHDETLAFVRESNSRLDPVIVKPVSSRFGLREASMVLSVVALGLFVGLYVL